MTRNPEQDVLDEIDRLVDAQLAQEPSGYDHNINQPRCPHPGCPREWHGLPVDGCPGSAAEGPVYRDPGVPMPANPANLYDLPDDPELVLDARRWLQGDPAPDFAEAVARINENRLADARAREAERFRNAIRTSPLRGARATLLNADMQPLGTLQPLGFTIDPNPASEEAAEAWGRTCHALAGATQQITVTFEAAGEAAREPVQALTDAPGPDATPQERALPRPSKKPPMWANDPTRSRRRSR